MCLDWAVDTGSLISIYFYVSLISHQTLSRYYNYVKKIIEGRKVQVDGSNRSMRNNGKYIATASPINDNYVMRLIGLKNTKAEKISVVKIRGVNI